MSSHRDKSGKPNRREFFKKAAAIGLGASVGGSSFWQPHQASAQITINGLHPFTGRDVRHSEQSVDARKGS
jgi:hypothetical protein